MKIRKYKINGWYRRYVLTAEELYQRVMSDSQRSNYNWIASATELVRVCDKRGFPLEYAKGIKMAILRCFTELNVRMVEKPSCVENSYQEPTDDKAVYNCYNSLSFENDDECSAKYKYLRSFIRKVIKHPNRPRIIYNKTEYDICCGKWEEEILFKCLSKKEDIYFEGLEEDLYRKLLKENLICSARLYRIDDVDINQWQ